LPNVVDPEKGFWATANENLIPQNYLHRDAVGWEWADSSRANRINEVLAKSNQLNLKDMMALQVDYVSLPARQLVPYVKNIPSANQLIKQSIDSLLNWNFELTMNSVAAGIYIAWERQLSRQAYLRLIPEAAQPYLTTLPLRIMLRAVQTDHPSLGGRDLFLTRCFEDAVDDLQKKFGDDLTSWKYGQPDYHHVLIRHPMSKVLNDSIRQLFECGPMPRGGSGSTPGMTGNGDNQLTGASFRMVVDVADWDQSMFTNAPGQSGDVRSPYYRNLFESWAKDQYFAVYFSRNKIESHAAGHLILQPH
jgi:penicillin amidase